MPSWLAPPPPPAGLRPGSVPTFAVVIPAYQAAGTVGDAVASALGQTRSPDEVLVCDDGSTDDLKAALRPFGDRITLLRQPNRGASAARNACVRAATADFVVPLDADDRMLPTRLQRLAELAAERPDLDLLATDARFVRDGVAGGCFHDNVVFAVDDQRLAILDRCFVICPALRRTRLERIGGYDEDLRTAEDWDCYLRLVLDGARAGLVAEPLLEYHLREGGLTAARAGTLWDRVTMLDKAARRGDLTAAERRTAAASRDCQAARARVAAAREALASGADDERARLLDVARQRGARIGTRVTAALAATGAPRWRRRARARL